jgi:uncharacterized protein YecA (UPF0149 family)
MNGQFVPIIDQAPAFAHSVRSPLSFQVGRPFLNCPKCGAAVPSASSLAVATCPACRRLVKQVQVKAESAYGSDNDPLLETEAVVVNHRGGKAGACPCGSGKKYGFCCLNKPVAKAKQGKAVSYSKYVSSPSRPHGGENLIQPDLIRPPGRAPNRCSPCPCKSGKRYKDCCRGK